MAKHTLELDDLELTALITHLEGQSEMMVESRLNCSNPRELLTLREGQISTILYCLEGYSQGNDDYELVEELDEIFEVLETTVDKFYNKIEKARAKRPEEEW